MAKIKTQTIVIIAAVVLGLFLLKPDLFEGLGLGSTTGGDSNDGDGDISGDVCSSNNALLKISAFDIELAGSSVGGSHRVYAPGNLVTSLTDASTSTVPVKSTFNILVGNNSESYYNKLVTTSTSCVDKYERVELANAGTLTLTAVNDDSITKNAAANRQAITADELVEVDVTYDVSANDYWGNPDISNKNVISCQYDKTYIQSVQVSGASRGNTPATHSFTNTTLDGVDSWEIGNLADGSKGQLTLEIQASSTEPVSQLIECDFYDANYDINENNLNVIEGIEDEDNNFLSLKNKSMYIYIS